MIFFRKLSISKVNTKLRNINIYTKIMDSCPSTIEEIEGERSSGNEGGTEKMKVERDGERENGRKQERKEETEKERGDLGKIKRKNGEMEKG